jgi:hypothetical protein
MLLQERIAQDLIRKPVCPGPKRPSFKGRNVLIRTIKKISAKKISAPK